MNYKDELYHYGKLGMKWGKRRAMKAELKALKKTGNSEKDYTNRQNIGLKYGNKKDIKAKEKYEARTKAFKQIKKEGKEKDLTAVYVFNGQKAANKILDKVAFKNKSYDEAVDSYNKEVVLKAVGTTLAVIGGSVLYGIATTS